MNSRRPTASDRQGFDRRWFAPDLERVSGTQNVDGSGPNQFGKYKSAYMNDLFTPTMIEALYEGLNENVEGADAR